VLVIDYRGFGDSSGTPSEDGLVTDAKAAFDWLISNGKKAEDILIMGHSLGTGVSGQLGAQFNKEGIVCKGIVFLSVSNVPSITVIRSDVGLAIHQHRTSTERLQYVWLHPTDQANIANSRHGWFVCFPKGNLNILFNNIFQK
jgi:alpha/beta superfamily hydrolase